MAGVSTSNTPRSAKKRRISATIAARFNKLAIGALGCQLAVSLMVLNSEVRKGMQSTCNHTGKQISHSAPSDGNRGYRKPKSAFTSNFPFYPLGIINPLQIIRILTSETVPACHQSKLSHQ